MNTIPHPDSLVLNGKPVNAERPLTEYSAGTLGYYDTFSGLVPCKVTKVVGDKITFVVTADHGPYRKGETMTWKGTSVVPRKQVVNRGYHLRIKTNYRWV